MRNVSKEFFRYLPVSERERQWGLYVRAGGFESVGPGESYPRSGHPHEFAGDAWSRGRILQGYQLHLITRGEGKFQSKPSGRKKIMAGNVFLLFPGVWHLYRPVPNVGWDAYWIDFNGQNVDRLVEHGFISPGDPVLSTRLDDLLLRAYTTLLDRLRSEPPGFEQLLAASAMEILAAALGAARVQTSGSHIHELVCRAKVLLEVHTEPVPAVEKVAASVGLSVAHFHRVFKEQTGLSPYQYHSQLRIERAKQMLHGTTMSVKQISAALAFENPFHFSKAFKEKAGMSPSRWRMEQSATMESSP